MPPTRESFISGPAIFDSSRFIPLQPIRPNSYPDEVAMVSILGLHFVYFLSKTFDILAILKNHFIPPFLKITSGSLLMIFFFLKIIGSTNWPIRVNLTKVRGRPSALQLFRFRDSVADPPDTWKMSLSIPFYSLQNIHLVSILPPGYNPIVLFTAICI